MLAIKVEHLSKAYQLGNFGTGTISRDLERWVAKMRGREDPFLRIGEANDRSVKGTSDVVWSLRDLDFEIQQGDAVGIVGKNGAGKSTILKILSRVTAPTSGKIKIKGRVASLLEVGTGFHPELTGRENIFLNGTILGMRKKEIKNKFDEILDFAGIDRYIDTPVKRYSSGMYVRLAFAVAAHLESEILIVDEVLAVGDSEFQNKCLRKMRAVSREDGRTVLFVSHNMNALTTLTNKAIYLKNGSLLGFGETIDIIREYQSDKTSSPLKYENLAGNGNAFVKEVSIVTSEPNNHQLINGPLEIIIRLCVRRAMQKPALSYQIVDSNNVPLVHNLIVQSDMDFGTAAGEYTLFNKIESLKLYPGNYSLIVHFAEGATNHKMETIENICDFEVVQYGSLKDYYWKPGSAKYIQENSWNIKFVKEHDPEPI